MTDQHTNEFPAEGRQPYAGHPYPAPPAPPKLKTRKLLTVILAVAAFLVGLAIGNPLSGSTPEPTTTVPPATQQADPEKPAEKAQKPKPAEEAQAYGDGTYEVGVDIQPGRYKVTVPDDAILCSYQRLKDDTGDAESIIAIDVKKPGAKASVTIKKSDGFFDTQGCGEWVRQ